MPLGVLSEVPTATPCYSHLFQRSHRGSCVDAIHHGDRCGSPRTRWAPPRLSALRRHLDALLPGTEPEPSPIWWSRVQGCPSPRHPFVEAPNADAQVRFAEEI